MKDYIGMPLGDDHIKDSARSRPDAEFVAAMRKKFPVEDEIDRVLTRKMTRRGGEPFAIPALETLADGARSLISEKLGYPVEIVNPKWLSGGASKLQMVFDLVWHGEDGSTPGTSTRLVLRMEPAASVTESSRLREFEVLRAVEGTLPVPHGYWVDAVLSVQCEPVSTWRTDRMSTPDFRQRDFATLPTQQSGGSYRFVYRRGGVPN